jgi:hypothetical protein
MLTLTLSTLLLAVSPSYPAAAQLTTTVQEPLDEQAKLPNAVVFFLPKSSVLSPVAADIVAIAARNAAGSGTIITLQPSSDREAGETAQTAAERAHAVRLALIDNGVPASAIRIVHVGVSRTGVESRRVIVSVMSAASSSPRMATTRPTRRGRGFDRAAEGCGCK